MFVSNSDIVKKGTYLFLAIYYPLIMWSSFILIRLYAKRKRKAIKSIVVDRNGIHYQFVYGKFESILFEQLERSPEYDSTDIDWHPRSRHTREYLYGFIAGEQKIIDFQCAAAPFFYLMKNRRQLRAHFLQGVELFRPDLKISPDLYRTFFIHPETYEFDRKSYGLNIMGIIISITIILLGIYLLMKYRFG
ncbi:hypothetical protein GCM10023231_17070 [Olivibacter ginsenosidimutans]|uniref:DUF3592 domain-containing protein n=1 Tax=Olivibacter ginsenosidimutans TaxID=1176537 RepID=A0ABP9B2S0_9SPHI